MNKKIIFSIVRICLYIIIIGFLYKIHGNISSKEFKEKESKQIVQLKEDIDTMWVIDNDSIYNDSMNFEPQSDIIRYDTLVQIMLNDTFYSLTPIWNSQYVMYKGHYDTIRLDYALYKKNCYDKKF